MKRAAALRWPSRAVRWPRAAGPADPRRDACTPPARGTLENADVLVQDGRIAAVGARPRGAGGRHRCRSEWPRR